jgi:peptidoglycan/LPS O-acetylase OafA/YrhL
MEVGTFFVLSGFVLTAIAKPGERPVLFWRRRAAKILPNHVVAWVAAAILMAVLGISISWRSAIPNLFLIHAWFPQSDVFFSMDFVSWSLSCEAVFYLCFPLLYRWVTGIKPERLWWWVGGLVAGTWVIPFIADLLPTHPIFVTIPTWHVWLIEFFPPVQAMLFVIGMLMARIVQTGKWINFGLWPAVALMFGGYLLASNIAEPWGFVAATSGPTVLLVTAAACADMKGSRNIFNTRLFVKGGELSFAFYLIHWLVLNFGHIALGGAAKQWPTPEAVGLGIAAFAISWALAWVLCTYVEEPIMRRFARPRPKPTVAVAEPVGSGGGRPPASAEA